MAASREFTGTVRVDAPVDRAFELFSPEGERAWVAGWTPELIDPPGVAWAEGQIFRTKEKLGDAIWIVTRLDRDRRFVEYHRVEPERYVARVRVTCRATGANTTEAAVKYRFVSLSPRGDSDIAAMTPEAYGERMDRWRRWIGAIVQPLG